MLTKSQCWDFHYIPKLYLLGSLVVISYQELTHVQTASPFQEEHLPPHFHKFKNYTICMITLLQAPFLECYEFVALSISVVSHIVFPNVKPAEPGVSLCLMCNGRKQVCRHVEMFLFQFTLIISFPLQKLLFLPVL